MRSILVLFFIVFNTSINAQKWLEPSAKWNYTHSNYSSGFESKESTTAFVEKDTIILGQLCQKMKYYDVQAFPAAPIAFYTFQSNDSIFFLINNIFFPAFRLNIQIGDTLVLLRPFVDTSYCLSNKKFYNYKIDSINTIGNPSLRRYYLSGCDTFKINNFRSINFIEKVGFNCLPYPYIPACVVDGDAFDLCNYGDSTIFGFWLLPNKTCIATGIMEKSFTNDNLKIYPNPSNYTLFLNTSLPHFTTQIYDLTGRVVASHEDTKEIEVSNLSSGVYLLRLQSGEGSVVRRFVKE